MEHLKSVVGDCVVQEDICYYFGFVKDGAGCLIDLESVDKTLSSPQVAADIPLVAGFIVDGGGLFPIFHQLLLLGSQTDPIV